MATKHVLDDAVSALGVELKTKLAVHAVSGDPEEQLRTPIDNFVHAAAAALGHTKVDVIGEVKMADVASRPDFAVVINDKLNGFIEVKAMGKGADPRRYRGHDKAQFDRLRLLPNVLYSDGQFWSLWQNGELVDQIESLVGDVEVAGPSLRGTEELDRMLGLFFSWAPMAPKSASELATVSARLCRFLREEVATELEEGDTALQKTAEDWRHLLFPDASDQQFADGYAQTVIFGLLLARAKDISLDQGTDQIAKHLGPTSSLIGRALAILGDAAENAGGLISTIDTAKRVLSVVDWAKLGSAGADTWLYFYEHFLQVYDSELRRQTGSYYTPPQVVRTMTSWTDEAVASLIGLPGGLANENVTIIDPAMGTGTFLLEVLRLLGDRYEQDYGAGGRGDALTERLKKIIGFELQLGPFAVAQLRLLAELASVGSAATTADLHAYVADTLSNPYQEDELFGQLGQWYEPIAASRRAANKIKREEQVLVILGNPPYREKAKGLGGWVESGSASTLAPFADYLPPKAWKLGPHVKNLRNLYVYFWRWATWKVFDSVDASQPGVVTLITVAGFLDGDGFQQMRAQLRAQATDIYVVDCSPEGLQPPVNTRIFESVQHPVCIVVAVRRPNADLTDPAVVRVRTLKAGNRNEKFNELAGISLEGEGWATASQDARSPFRAAGAPEWIAMPALEDLFKYNGSGVMPGRTWPIAADRASLEIRWNRLHQEGDIAAQRGLFSEGDDRKVDKALKDALPGYQVRAKAVREDDDLEAPVRYAYRSLDRQWIYPDKRLINRPNPTLWAGMSSKQVFLSALEGTAPNSGPMTSVASSPPDMHHYKGHGGGRVYPLWADQASTVSNFHVSVMSHIESQIGRQLKPEDLFAYIVGTTAHPGYTDLYSDYLANSVARVPITIDPDLFDSVALVGAKSIFLQTYGARGFYPGCATATTGAPRMSEGGRPRVSADAPIPTSNAHFPNELDLDEESKVLHVGAGRIENVSRAMFDFEFGGVNVLDKWFSYRRKDRTRPQVGKRRVSELEGLNVDHWLSEYTTDLVDLLNVIGLLVELQPSQADLLVEVASGAVVADLPALASADGATASSDATASSAAKMHGQVELGI